MDCIYGRAVEIQETKKDKEGEETRERGPGGEGRAQKINNWKGRGRVNGEAKTKKEWQTGRRGRRTRKRVG